MVSRQPSVDPLITACTEGALRTWTFAVCFGGDLAHLKCLVESIRRQATDDDEILIVADEDAEVPASLGAKVIRVDAHSNALAVKKHRLVAEARGDFLCILHDYLELSDGWREGFESLGALWDVASSPTLDPSRRNRRIADWMTLDHPIWGHGLIPYDIRSETDYMFLSGMYMCLRVEFLRENNFNFDPTLDRGVPEDQVFARLIREGARWEFNVRSRVYSQKRKKFPGTRHVRFARARLWSNQRGQRFGRIVNWIFDSVTLRNVLRHVSSVLKRT